MLRPLLLCCLLVFIAAETFSQQNQEVYQCMPCGYDCDAATYSQPGQCPHCHMQLVKKAAITFKTIKPSEICQYIAEHPNVVLLDVRTREEFEGKTTPRWGTLKNAINIPIQELEAKLSSISHLKNKEIIVFCSQSHRSPRASYLLTSSGFVDVTNMEGGLSVMEDSSCKSK